MDNEKLDALTVEIQNLKDEFGMNDDDSSGVDAALAGLHPVDTAETTESEPYDPDTDLTRFADLTSTDLIGVTAEQQRIFDENNGHTVETQRQEDDVLRSIIRGDIDKAERISGRRIRISRRGI